VKQRPGREPAKSLPSFQEKFDLGHYFVELKAEFRRTKGPRINGRRIEDFEFSAGNGRILEEKLKKEPRRFEQLPGDS